MRRRRWLAIAGLSCALLGAWGAMAFLREPPVSEGGDSIPRRTAAAAASADLSRDEAGGDASRGSTPASKLTPTVVAVEPRLEWPDAAALRRIEQHGRVLFGGVVDAPDGSPCPGASVWCSGAAMATSANRKGATEGPIATTDDHGAWRADVGVPFYFGFDADLGFNVQSPPSFVLAARKEGVGFAEAQVDATSRRVDLHLSDGGFSFGGTVVDNDDLRPVGGAELEARIRSFVERVRADESGGFRIASLPAGNLDLSGRAPGYDSNGSFPYNFDRGRDVTITFRLTKSYRLRGQFAPWPAPDVPPASASVLLSPRSPHSSTPPAPSGAVDADGSFDVTLPVCPECRVELVSESGTIWQTDVDVNEEKHDVDLGRIEIAQPAALTGRVELPSGGLSAEIEAAASIAIEGSRGVTVRRKVAADGTFRLAPLAAGPCTLVVTLGGAWLARLESASGISSEERAEGWIELTPGETRDVGVITPTESIVFGTVRDSRGEPVAHAQLLRVHDLGSGSNPRIFGFVFSATDEGGRYHRDLDWDVSEVSRAFTVCARGFAPLRVEIETPARGRWIRRDVVLPDGVVLRGTLRDESGAPLPGWSIHAAPADAERGTATARAACDVTLADGSFEIRGLTAGEWKVRAREEGRTPTEFTKIRPEEGPVALRVVEGVRLSTSR